MTFNRGVDAVDYLMRVYMRVRTWIAPIGIGRTFFGAKMHCDTRDYIQRRVYYFGIFEPNLTHYIGSRVVPGDVFIDVGANVGYVSLLASHLVGEAGKVVAIEASPTTFARLTDNLDLNGAHNVVALNLAATSEPCAVEIVPGEARNSGSNSIKAATPGASVTVRGDALSSIIGRDKERVRFIKIDVEGSEAPILQDILATLDEFPNLGSIAVELGSGSAPFLAQFAARGFKAYGLPNNYRIGYLFLRKYLARSGEDGFFIKTPVTAHDARYTDYVLERDVAATGTVPGAGDARSMVDAMTARAREAALHDASVTA